MERFGSLAALANADPTLIAAETHVSLEKAEEIQETVKRTREAQEVLKSHRVTPRTPGRRR